MDPSSTDLHEHPLISRLNHSLAWNNTSPTKNNPHPNPLHALNFRFPLHLCRPLLHLNIQLSRMPLAPHNNPWIHQISLLWFPFIIRLGTSNDHRNPEDRELQGPWDQNPPQDPSPQPRSTHPIHRHDALYITTWISGLHMLELSVRSWPYNLCFFAKIFAYSAYAYHLCECPFATIFNNEVPKGEAYLRRELSIFEEFIGAFGVPFRSYDRIFLDFVRWPWDNGRLDQGCEYSLSADAGYNNIFGLWAQLLVQKPHKKHFA